MELNIKGIVGGVIALILGIVVISESVINLDANEIAVVQSVRTGALEVYTSSGPKLVWFGKVTRYPKQSAYVFDKVDGVDTSALVQFNDGGTATMYGSVNWNMPLDTKSILKIHNNFHDHVSVENNAIVKSLNSAIYLSGPLMSSTESAGERRSELVQLINDQAKNGVYVTRVENKQIKEAGDKEERTVKVTAIVKDSRGMPLRQQGSLLAEYNLGLQPLAIKRLAYDDVVVKQISDRQKATTAVELAKAELLKAEQNAKTEAAKGEAEATKAKWAQEVIKAKEVTAAQQRFEVATLEAKAAEQYKQKQILEGQGDAEKKRLVMQANGALDAKLEAWVKAQGYWANAFKERQGDLVPKVVMGNTGTSASASGNAQAMSDLFLVKMAKDLGVDMDVRSK